jgi:hypothetical protein
MKPVLPLGLNPLPWDALRVVRVQHGACSSRHTGCRTSPVLTATLAPVRGTTGGGSLGGRGPDGGWRRGRGRGTRPLGGRTGGSAAAAERGHSSCGRRADHGLRDHAGASLDDGAAGDGVG